MHETPYLGVMYILLMIASDAVSFVLLHSGSPITWSVGGALAAATLIGLPPEPDHRSAQLYQ